MNKDHLQCSKCRTWFHKDLRQYGYAMCPECVKESKRKSSLKCRTKKKIKTDIDGDWMGSGHSWIY